MIRRLGLLAGALAAAGGAGGQAQEQPPGQAGTAAYSEWLARSFVTRLLPQPSGDERARVMEQIISPDYVQHNAYVPPGRQGLAQTLEAFHSTVSDEKVELEDVVATPDKVVARYTVSGTVEPGGQPDGASPGRRLHVSVIDIWAVKDGRLHEHWD